MKEQEAQGLDTLVGHLPDRNKLCFIMPNSHIATTYVAEVNDICVTSVPES